MGSFTVWELLLYSGTDSFFSDPRVPLCIVRVLHFTSCKSSIDFLCVLTGFTVCFMFSTARLRIDNRIIHIFNKS